ncbi:major histocompatibility complex class I-related gene protein-like isoform X2 [Silurus meridionalis]|uniref:major histocompatibility complex class I-related gene protein-like isoform X2 n=1 Tax=Silurus meridionalis TaxID=175797 RepID=UPI001EEC4836|nr:major histocompatibility complex class I-related gene protein-like isoform X2 [Silurus meridionalis]
MMDLKMKMMMKVQVGVCVFMTLVLAPGLGVKHTLFYTYTALSQPLELPGIYEFTALGMLDDRELDYYSSKTQVKVPKQNWMKEKMPQDYWEKGTQSRKSKEQWFKVNVDILIERMRHNKTDLHVLQWRHGCEIDKGADGNLKFLKGIDEYSYDGTEFLSFDEKNSIWIAPVQAAEPTKRKWDEVPILNQYTKGYLEKECVDWLSKFMEYGQEELKTFSKPKVYMFVKKSVKDPSMLTLTCLATGFYPPDVQMQVIKYRTSLPEHLLTSSGVRPNGDNTYQLRKSVDINSEDRTQYKCQVTHNMLETVVRIDGDVLENCPACETRSSGIVGAIIGVLLVLVVAAVVLSFLWKKGYLGVKMVPKPRMEERCNITESSLSRELHQLIMK